MQQLDVINTALGATGKEPLIDLTAPTLAGSAAAQKLMRSIEPAREAVLSRHGWLCALEYPTLAPWAPPAAYVNWRYPAAYLLPGDALRVWEVGGDCDPAAPDGSLRWEVGTFETEASARQVLRVTSSWCAAVADPAGNLPISYVRRANWASLPGHMADAIAYETAARQAFSITGDKGLAKDLKQQAEMSLQQAIGLDATQSGGQPALAPSIPAAIRAYAGNVDFSYSGAPPGYGWGGW